MHAAMTWIWSNWANLLLAGLAGWLAGRMVRRRSPALAPSLVIGLLGWLLGIGAERLLGIVVRGAPALLVNFVIALVGSVLLWVAIRLLKRA